MLLLLRSHLYMSHLYASASNSRSSVFIVRLNYRIVEVPVNWTEIAGSKLQPAVAAFQMTRDIATIKLLYCLGVWHPK